MFILNWDYVPVARGGLGFRVGNFFLGGKVTINRKIKDYMILDFRFKNSLGLGLQSSCLPLKLAWSLTRNRIKSIVL